METRQGKRILLATIGSLGDLHPCIALGLELKGRGHTVVIASTGFYREKVEALGLGFHALRPDWQKFDYELIRECEDMRRGPEVLFRKIILPHLRDTYADLLGAAAGIDLMIAGETVYPAPLIAQKLGLRWATLILSPVSFFSAHDPSVLANVPWAYWLRRAGSIPNRILLNIGRFGTRHWWSPVRELRKEVGLSPRADPLFRDKFSPHLVLALFSRYVAGPQPDWPHNTMQPGYLFFDQDGLSPANERLAEFMAAGEAPLVFTQGSTAVHNPGNFYEESVKAAKLLGRRAVLLIGENPVPEGGSSKVLALPYAPYSEAFPKASVIVHQGGSGTTAQALRAGRPMLIVPYGWDQPDNGARVERLGAGIVLPRNRYHANSAARMLNRLLSTPGYAQKADEIGSRIRAESGATDACDAIERLMGQT